MANRGKKTKFIEVAKRKAATGYVNKSKPEMTSCPEGLFLDGETLSRNFAPKDKNKRIMFSNGLRPNQNGIHTKVNHNSHKNAWIKTCGTVES